MIRSLLVLFVLSIAPTVCAQNNLKLVIRNQETNEPIVGATVSTLGTDLTSTTNGNGQVELINIPSGEHMVEIFSPGYETKQIKLIFPLADQNEQVILLSVSNEVGEVTITSTTRISREIEDVPNSH
jgi:iron complex outermembrane receptor protein